MDQVHPIFPGWLTILASKQLAIDNTALHETLEIYLPPIMSKVTDPNTIFEYIVYMQKVAEKVNMKYVNITLDVGAAINAFKVLWTYPDIFSNVVLHLGDFHLMKENFKV